MNEIIRILNEKSGFVHMTPASEIYINDAEEQLQVRFSDEYRAYLSSYGCASFAGHELTGICRFSRLNVVDVTLKERKLNPNVPQNFYVIEQTHINGIVIWQDEDGSVYSSLPNLPPAKRFDSLLAYISQE